MLLFGTSSDSFLPCEKSRPAENQASTYSIFSWNRNSEHRLLQFLLFSGDYDDRRFFCSGSSSVHIPDFRDDDFNIPVQRENYFQEDNRIAPDAFGAGFYNRCNRRQRENFVSGIYVRNRLWFLLRAVFDFRKTYRRQVQHGNNHHIHFFGGGSFHDSNFECHSQHFNPCEPEMRSGGTGTCSFQHGHAVSFLYQRPEKNGGGEGGDSCHDRTFGGIDNRLSFFERISHFPENTRNPSDNSLCSGIEFTVQEAWGMKDLLIIPSLLSE